MIFASFLPSKAGFDIFGLKLWGATALFFELVAVRAINAWSRAASWDCACERRCAGVGKEMNYCCELLLLVCVRWSCVSAEASGVKWGGEVAEMRSGSSDLQYIFYFSDGPMIWIAEIVKSSDDGSSIVNAHVDGAEISTVMIRMQDTDVEMRFPCESTSNHDDCSTSNTHPTMNVKVCQRNKSHAVGEGRRRKRWRERSDDPYFPAGILSNESNKREGSEKNSPSDSTYKEDRCETVLSIKDLADRGMAAEVVKEVEALDPEFFGHNSLLLFQLKQVEFLKLVDSGDYSGALKVACSHLGPLAANNHDLLKPLKETLLALLRPNEVDFKRDLPLHALASSLQVAIGRRLGIEEPQLMKVMQATLHSHTEWFNLQMCKDRFESFLKIDALKEVNSLLLADAVSKSHLCAQTYGSSQITISSSSAIPEDSNSPTQVSSREVCDEGAILKVMEFLALPRADAIHLLAQCNGNAETAIQHIFGEI